MVKQIGDVYQYSYSEAGGTVLLLKEQKHLINCVSIAHLVRANPGR